MLKKWNAHTFGNNISQIAKSKSILGILKSRTLDFPTTKDLSNKEKKLDNLLKRKEMLWAKKTRIN